MKEFTKSNILEVNERLGLALREFCKVEGLEYCGSKLSYTAQSFDAKVSVKIPGGLSFKEQRQSIGFALDSKGVEIKIDDLVMSIHSKKVYTMKGYRRVKAIVVASDGKQWLIPFRYLEKVGK